MDGDTIEDHKEKECNGARISDSNEKQEAVESN